MRPNNDRRIDLIIKKCDKYGAGLTSAEETELAELQAQMNKYVEQNAPRDTMRLDELEEKVLASGS